MRTIPTFLALSVVFLASAHAAPKKAETPAQPAMSTKPSSDPSKGIPDTNRVRKLYQDGDFDGAIAILEESLKNGKVVAHEDSVFTFKHLGVMYAANANTRERGKYYMMQLLLIEPTARIMDMYASDMIYMIFKNIQEEVAATQSKLHRAEGHVAGNQGSINQARPAKVSAESSSKSKPSSGKKYYWIGGAAVLAVGVGVAAYILSDESPASVENTQVD
jgi:hypothetical protein